MSDPNTGFIVAAYAVTALAIAAMTLSIWLDHRALKKALAKFPARGSDGAEP